VLAACATAVAVHAAGAAETYPIRPIRMIVPQSAGGSTDLVARIIAQRLDDTLKQLALEIERVKTYEVAITDIQRAPALINEMAETIQKIGMSPLKF